MNRRLYLLTVMLLMAGVSRWQLQAIEPGGAVDLDGLPFALGEWTGQAGPPLDAETLQVLAADGYLTRVYRKSGTPDVGLFVSYYRSQKSGSAMHSPLNCLPGAGWQPLSTERVPFGPEGAARRVLIEKGQDRNLVLYWYASARRLEGDEYLSKLYLVMDAIRWRRNDAALVRFVTPIQGADGEAVAERALFQMAHLAEPELRKRMFR